MPNYSWSMWVWRNARNGDNGLFKDWIIISNDNGEQDKTFVTNAEKYVQQQKDLKIVAWKWYGNFK